MKALVFTADQLCTMHEMEQPLCGENESLIEIEAAGICGSDMHAWHGHDTRRRPPLILGHEICGTVLKGHLKGQRVTANPIATCGSCPYCVAGRDNLCINRTMIGMSRPGGFAQYLTIPNQCLVAVGDLEPNLAVLTEPAAVCVHGISMLKRLHLTPIESQKILIIGGGAIGILTALILKQKYQSAEIHISEANPKRLQSCESICPVINPLKETIDQQGYDSVFDAVGKSVTRTQAISAVKAGGVVIHLGLQEDTDGVNSRTITLGEILFAGAFTYTMQEIRDTVKLLQNIEGNHWKINNWLEQMPLSSGQSGFEMIHSGSTSAAKILLIP